MLELFFVFRLGLRVGHRGHRAWAKDKAGHSPLTLGPAVWRGGTGGGRVGEMTHITLFGMRIPQLSWNWDSLWLGPPLLLRSTSATFPRHTSLSWKKQQWNLKTSEPFHTPQIWSLSAQDVRILHLWKIPCIINLKRWLSYRNIVVEDKNRCREKIPFVQKISIIVIAIPTVGFTRSRKSTYR